MWTGTSNHSPQTRRRFVVPSSTCNSCGCAMARPLQPATPPTPLNFSTPHHVVAPSLWPGTALQLVEVLAFISMTCLGLIRAPCNAVKEVVTQSAFSRPASNLYIFCISKYQILGTLFANLVVSSCITLSSKTAFLLQRLSLVGQTHCSQKSPISHLVKRSYVELK